MTGLESSRTMQKRENIEIEIAIGTGVEKIWDRQLDRGWAQAVRLLVLLQSFPISIAISISKTAEVVRLFDLVARGRSVRDWRDVQKQR